MRSDINLQNLINDYKLGNTVENISEKYNVSLWFIYNVLKKNNINKKIKQSGLSLETLDRNIVIDLYNNGKSASFIAKQLGCSHTLILDFFDKNHIKKIDRKQLIRKFKNIKLDYFDNIDSEEKAYFLGLLYADGCNEISKNSSSISINLQEEDKEILEKLSFVILQENALKFLDLSKRKKKNQWRLRICNKSMCQKLFNLGCVSAKSLTLSWPNWLNDSELQRHFIRGYFDGDGSINCNEDNYNAYKFSIVSTLNFCQNVDRVINEQLKIHFCYDYNKNGITTTISVNGNRQILELMNWLYKDATIYFSRKYQKYLELRTWLEDIDSRKNSTNNQINQYC